MGHRPFLGILVNIPQACPSDKPIKKQTPENEQEFALFVVSVSPDRDKVPNTL